MKIAGERAAAEGQLLHLVKLFLLGPAGLARTPLTEAAEI